MQLIKWNVCMHKSLWPLWMILLGVDLFIVELNGINIWMNVTIMFVGPSCPIRRYSSTFVSFLASYYMPSHLLNYTLEQNWMWPHLRTFCKFKMWIIETQFLKQGVQQQQLFKIHFNRVGGYHIPDSHQNKTSIFKPT